MIVGCGQCRFLERCGGLDGALDLFGCHQATAETCRRRRWTCPDCNPAEFLRRLSEIEARARRDQPVLAMTAELPPYVANIQHARNWIGVLQLPIVALPTRRVVGGRGRYFGPRYPDAARLRRHFHVPQNARILLITVAPDAYLEQYWGWGRLTHTPERMAALGIAGISIPNFSFFSDAHRFHLLYNRDRIAASLAELSAAGVPVIPHVHAFTNGDRGFWIGWLRATPQVRYVCREFQTGNDESAIDELARIQDEIGRELHPIVVGGARYVARLRERFVRSTVVDSVPFMGAQHGRRAVIRDGRLCWVENRWSSRRGLGALIRDNVNLYADYISNRYEEGRQLSMIEALERAIRVREERRARSAVEPSRMEQQQLVYIRRAKSAAPATDTTPERDPD